MNCELACQVGMLLNNTSIFQIDCDTNFWMLRTKSGYFYNEFIKEKYIALGWNYIDSYTSYDKDNIERLKEMIKNYYHDKVPMTAINKCNKFINEIKEGDFVVIPNKGSSKVAICKVGEYYEEKYDTLNELLEIKKIENKECEIGSIKCPYKKRRKIEVLLEVSTKRVSHALSKAIGSYHGLSSLNDYATDILNCVYGCYEYGGDIFFSINIAKKSPVKARELSRLMQGVSEVFCELSDDENVSVVINLNSPGKLTVKLQKGYNKLKKGAVPLLILSVALFGGGVGEKFDATGIVPGVIEAVKEIRTMSIEEKTAEAELQGKELDNYLKAMELVEKSQECEIDKDKFIKNIESLSQIGIELQFETNEEFANEEGENVNNVIENQKEE